MTHLSFQKLTLLFLFSISGILFLNHLALAVDLNDALQKKAAAQNEYYKQMRKLGPNFTATQDAEVRAKTITPAAFAFNNAIGEKMSEISHEVQSHVYGMIKKKAPDFFKKETWAAWGKKLGLIQDKDGKKPGSSSGPSKASSDTSSRPMPSSPEQPREDLILDGSKIPREISFPGKKKGGSLTDVGSNSEPESPQVQGEQKVDVIEFTPSSPTKVPKRGNSRFKRE